MRVMNCLLRSLEWQSRRGDVGNRLHVHSMCLTTVSSVTETHEYVVKQAQIFWRLL